MTYDAKLAQSAIDFHGLNQLRAAANKDAKKQETLRQVAGQFESLFVTMMLKSMREASLGDGIFDSSQSKMYQDMSDQQLASDLSSHGGLGLQDIIYQQLGGDKTESGKMRVTAGQAYSIDTVTIRPTLGRQVSAQIIEKIKESMGSESLISHKNNDSDPIDFAIDFASPKDFVEKLWPMASKAAEKIGVAPEVILSQAALETGWGKHVLFTANGDSSFNLFNIKADPSWSGGYTSVNAVEYRDGVPLKESSRFRRYDSYQQSFDDYVNFLQTQPRYQKALQNTDDASTFVEELHKAGYATDPHYADKIKRIMSGATLAQISQEDMYL